MPGMPGSCPADLKLPGGVSLPPGLAWFAAGFLAAGIGALAAFAAQRRIVASHNASHRASSRPTSGAALAAATEGQEPHQQQPEPPRGGEHLQSSGQEVPGRPESAEEGEEEEDVPQAFVDPITFGVMHDPAVLCGTGQVYNYSSIRDWLSLGQRRCPKSNLPLLDVEVVRLPLLRHAVHDWMAQHGMPIPQQEVTEEVLAAADFRFPRWVADLRCGDVSRRGIQAAAQINDVLIKWGKSDGVGEELRQHREAAMGHVIDDLVWLLRHGDSYSQGVACAALSQYHLPEHRQWLAAVAAIPAAQLLSSRDDYARHSTARLLSVLARVHPHMPDVLCRAGAVPGLLAQIDLSRPLAYTRCSAASALCGIAAGDGGGQEDIRKAGGLDLLAKLVLQEEGEGPNAHGEYLARFCKRDAAWALVELDLSEEELQSIALSLVQLLRFKHCSQAWLKGEVDLPNQGYTPEERETQQLAAQQGQT